MFLHFHSSSTLTWHTKFESFPKEDSYRPIVPAQSRLVVVPGAWYHTATASPFWWTAHSLVVRTLGIIAGGGVALRLWGLRLLLGSSTWSNSLITGDYPAASARSPYCISKSVQDCTTTSVLLQQYTSVCSLTYLRPRLEGLIFIWWCNLSQVASCILTNVLRIIQVCMVQIWHFVTPLTHLCETLGTKSCKIH